MQIKWNYTIAVAALAAIGAAANAQNPSNGTYLGLEAGAYFPSDRVIRDVFGSTLPRIGINFINNNRPEKFKPSFNFAVIGANKDGNRFLAIPVTVGVGQQLGGENASTRPYWRVGAGVAYLDYSIDTSGTGANRIDNNRISFCGVAEGGILLSERVRVSAAYNYFQKADDFNFSGWEIKVSFLFWKV